MTDSPLITFHLGQGVDTIGRGRTEILEWPDYRLEQCHDYIQWLFPLATRSRFNPEAPVLSPEDIAAFRGSSRLQESLRTCLIRMLAFYGLELREFPDFPEIAEGRNFEGRRRYWLTVGNHNFLRITRILMSLRTLGLETCAESFFDLLELLYRRNRGIISDVTYRYWQDAVYTSVDTGRT